MAIARVQDLASEITEQNTGCPNCWSVQPMSSSCPGLTASLAVGHKSHSQQRNSRFG